MALLACIFLLALILIVCSDYYEPEELKEKVLENITVCISFFVSPPIVISNLLKIGRTTYGTEMAGNIIDWFSLPFDATTHHPRNYATKFFFKEGNTIELRGFGTFEPRLRKGRSKARNPKTGALLTVAPHYVAAFRSGQELKKSLWDLPVLPGHEPSDEE